MARNKQSIGEPLFPYQASTPEDEERKEEYRKRLAVYLKDPEFRQIEGFPIGTDEDILALSDPPYYTACPNPFLPEILEDWQQERRKIREELGLPLDDARYRREPFAADVSEGKNDPIYNAHSYHTKVPHKAIMRYILHYTDPGDIVFDGFCGTGMTGVAAQLCGDKAAVEALGYIVKPDGKILDENGKVFSRLGARKTVLNDLSPAATFIAYNYNTPVNADAFEKEARRILQEVEDECGWMYETWHPHCDDPKRVKARINYTVWSEVFSCPQCIGEIIFFDLAFDKESKRVREDFPCPNCGLILQKRQLDRQEIRYFDSVLGETAVEIKRKPVLIEYEFCKQKCTKTPDREDLAVVDKINELPTPHGFVQNKLPFMHMTHQRAKLSNHGVSHMHQFYLRRARQAIALMWKKSNSIVDSRLRLSVLFAVEQLLWGMSLLNRYVPTHYSQVNRYISGIYYVSSLISEVSPWYILNGKIKRLGNINESLKTKPGGFLGLTSSSTSIYTKESSIDYIFTDPPFGENIYYADLNFLVESWHKVFTNSTPEAIIDRAKSKKLRDYQDLMRKNFLIFYRSLKPGRWMTVEFHNSHNVVWNAIQESLNEAGFIIADVRTLDKQANSYRQITATTIAKQDLAISAYKPKKEFTQQFRLDGGTEGGAWAFIRQHLEQLPLPDMIGGVLRPQQERLPYLLYDRLVAFHLVRGLSIPLSVGEFNMGLGIRFLARDGMYFTSSQAADYDRIRIKAEKVEQLALFVINEETAIQWLHQVLDPSRGGKHQTYAELQPEFLKQLHQEKHEKMPELLAMLEQNFLINAEGQWYAPDPDKQADLEALRTRALLHEFHEYSNSKGRLKVFRSEAVRAGFSKAWKERDYKTIVQVSERLPEAVVQEDSKLKMYYDNAIGRVERQPRQEPLL
jgi:hypothetical protein